MFIVIKVLLWRFVMKTHITAALIIWVIVTEPRGIWGGEPSLKITLVKGQLSLTPQGVEVYLTRPMMTVSGLCLRTPLIKRLTLIDRTSISVVAAIYLPTKELSTVLSSWVNQTQSRSLLPRRCLWCLDWLRKVLYIVEADSNLFWYVSLLV